MSHGEWTPSWWFDCASLLQAESSARGRMFIRIQVYPPVWLRVLNYLLSTMNVSSWDKMLASPPRIIQTLILTLTRKQAASMSSHFPCLCSAFVTQTHDLIKVTHISVNERINHTQLCSLFSYEYFAHYLFTYQGSKL